MARWYNPFKRIKALNDEIAKLNAELDFWIEEERGARAKAYWEMKERFDSETQMLRAHNQSLLEQLAKISSMTIRGFNANSMTATEPNP